MPHLIGCPGFSFATGPYEIYSWLMPIEYEMEQLLHLWIEWIDAGSKYSSEYMKGYP